MKLLIVDDEPNIVMALEYAFKKLNYDVYIARDGLEAVQLAKQMQPDAIILDIMMPNLDGYETLKQIKQINSLENTKVIFLSAKNKQIDIEKGFKMGADDYITKPFSIKKLSNKVHQLIHQNN